MPDQASAWYFVRAPHMKDVKSTMERLKKVAQGAAMMTETTVDIEMGCGCCELSTNEALKQMDPNTQKKNYDLQKSCRKPWNKVS